MARVYRHPTWNDYKMDWDNPHRELEPLSLEIEVVQEALTMLQDEGILSHTNYDLGLMLAHRRAVAESFEIPWTAITPRMQRLLYAINAIAQPQTMIAAGVFCGNTFISNAGAGVGPGACYSPRDLIGVEIVVEEAIRAERNVRRMDPTGVARVLAADAIDVVREHPEAPNLLYLDADGTEDRGKGIYLEILQTCYHRMRPGAIILAHNSINGGPQVEPYLEWVRDPDNCRTSVNVILDREGLEVSAV